jgi:hypothetical protein
MALAVLGLSVATLMGCGDDDGEESRGGDLASAGAAGLGSGAGALSCDCGEDVNQAHIPLDCACSAGLCTTFADDLAAFRETPLRLGAPYYVLLGTCADGKRTLFYSEATEQTGSRTYDADGRMLYKRFRGYDGAVPAACGFDEPFGLGRVTIGEDTARECTQCLLATDDPNPDGSGGAGGADGDYPGWYPERGTAPCESSDLE